MFLFLIPTAKLQKMWLIKKLFIIFFVYMTGNSYFCVKKTITINITKTTTKKHAIYTFFFRT